MEFKQRSAIKKASVILQFINIIVNLFKIVGG